MISVLHLFLILAPIAGAACAQPGDRTIPARIVTIAPNADEIICSLGACDSIVAVSEFTVHPPELASRPRIGGLFNPNVERIVALRPDLIVLRGHNEEIERLCRQRGIRLFLDQTDSLADITKNVRALGELLGREDRAVELIAEFEQRLDAVRRRTQGRDKPRVFLTVARNPDELANILTAGKGSFLDETITLAGGTNVFSHVDMMYPQISPEEIIARRPDVIIELMPEASLTPQRERELHSQWSRFALVPAVRDQRVHFITDDNAMIPSPRYVEIIEKLAAILHPDLRTGNDSAGDSDE